MNKKRLGKLIALSSVFVLSSVTGLVVSGCNQHEHNLTEIAAVDPTCTTDGRSTYYVCDGCELIFADAEGKKEIDISDTVKPKLNHDLEHHDANPATCTQPGNIEYWECKHGDGKFSDEEGKNPVTNVVITKEHTWGTDGHHEQVNPTTDAEGVKEYWHCSECGLDYADEFGDRTITADELKIDRVSENIDGVRTDSFYRTDNALTIGGADVLEGGKGIVINAMRANDGVYLHVVVNYDVEATKQPAGKGKIGLYFNVRNSENLNLPGGAGVCLEQAMLMELYLTGKVDYHKPYFLIDFDTTENGADAKTKYTGTWEMFIPHSGFATVNNGAFANAFETVDGKTALKSGYTYMLTAIGAFDPTETFANNGASQCTLKDGDTWAFWTNDGHGDWAADQKYYALGTQGITPDFQRATDTYEVDVNDYANATVTGLTDTVDYDDKLAGTVTVNEGYRLSGIKVNGQVFVFRATDDRTYSYEIPVSEIKNLKWNDTVLTVEIVVTKLDYQAVEVTLQGNAGGKTQNIAQGTSVTLISEFGDEYSSEVGADGKVQFENVLCQDYSVIIEKYIDGLLTVVKGEQTAEATLEYHFAHNAGTRPDLVDLTDMNAENASITLGEQGVNGVDQNDISVQLNLPDEIKNAEAYVLYTTVTVNGEVINGSNTWLQRFGIRFAEGDAKNTYKNKFVIWWDDLGLNSNPSAIWANDETTCGGGAERAFAYDWLQSSVLDGLKIKLVRNGSYVSVSVYNLDNERWYTLLSGTTSATAKNDITFYVSGESFTFSEISYEALEVVPLVLPVGNTDGVKGHLIASNGDVFTFGGIMTSADELAIPANSIAYTDYDNIDIESENGLITIYGNGLDDRDSHTANYATYILPEAVREEEEISLTFNIKDIRESQGTYDWAARRLGIQIGEGAYGLYFWTPYNNEFNVIKFVTGTLDMNTDTEGMDIAKAHWAAPMIRSANGLDVQIVRIGDKIIVNIKNDNGEWVRVGETNCPVTAETEIKFVGGGDTWEISQIAAGTLEKVEEKDATHEADGNIAYYTDGVNYYLTDGTVTTAEEVIIPQIVEKEVEITLEVYGTDGNKVEADLSNVKVTLTGEYDYNKNIYTNLAVSNGVLALTDGKIFEGEYAVTVNGYAVDAIVVDDETSALTLKLYKISSYQVVEVEKTGNVGVKLSTDGAVVTVTGSGLVDDNATWAGTAELILPDEVKNSKNVVLSFTIKLTYENVGGWDWAARRFGVTMQGTNGGFMCFTSKSDEASLFVMGNKPGAEEDKISCDALAALVRSANGAQFRLVRNGGSVAIYVLLDNEMVKLGAYPCSADGETKLVFYGVGDTWQFSDIIVSTAPAAFANPDGSIKVSEDIVYHAYVAPSIETDGCNAYYSVGNAYYTEKGETTTLEDLKIAKLAPTEITITVKGYKDGVETLLNGTVTAKGEYETSFSGTLENGSATVNAYVVTYTVSVDGYISKEFTVVDGKNSYEIVLDYEYAVVTGNVDISNMNNAVSEITIVAQNKDGANNWTGSAQLVLDENIGTDVVFETNIKMSVIEEGWTTHSTQQRFAIRVTESGKGFYMWMWRDGVSKASVRPIGDINSSMSESGGDNLVSEQGDGWIYDLLVSESGADFRVARVGSIITLNIKKNGVWVSVASITCEENDKTQIAVYGVQAQFKFTGLTVSTLTAVNAKAPSETENGNLAYYYVGANYYTVEGKAVTLEQVTLHKIEAPDYTFNGEVTPVNRESEVTVSSDSLVFKSNATGDWPDYDANPIKVTLNQTFEKDKAVEINFNLKGGDSVFWASDRFGIEVAGTNGLFVWNNEKAGMTCGIVDETMKTETLKLGEFDWLGNAIASDDGANIKLVRIGGVISCYAQNGTEWVYLGWVACSEDAATEIAFIAKGATWTVTGLTVTEIETVTE